MSACMHKELKKILQLYLLQFVFANNAFIYLIFLQC